MSAWRERYDDYAKQCDKAIDQVFSDNAAMHPMMRDAMRYSLFAGGKRLRGVLLLASYVLFKQNIERALPYAAAMEMIHCYSLIHDDLPAMDDDDYRRGNPTSHKVFGEANAILAGDALLNLAYETMVSAAIKDEKSDLALSAMQKIARSAGASGMIGGQAADIESEKTQKADEKTLYYIHSHKTAALIEASVIAGAILAGASLKEQHALMVYASQLGLSFQASDDILDVTGDQETMGKTLGKDEKAQKLTAVSLYGLEKARMLLRQEVQTAEDALAVFDEKADMLREIVRLNLSREK